MISSAALLDATPAAAKICSANKHSQMMTALPGLHTQHRTRICLPCLSAVPQHYDGSCCGLVEGLGYCCDTRVYAFVLVVGVGRSAQPQQTAMNI